jgi:hypothetical protein
VHITTDNDQMDKVGEAAQTMSRATHKSAYTAMDYALEAQEINTKLLQQTTQAWIDGFRYQAKLSQGMAQVFFGQWGNALASMPRTTPVVEPSVQRQSRSEVTGEPATNDAQKVTETAAKDDQENTEKAETRKAEKAAEETQKATETDAEETQKSTEVVAKDAQKSTETATFPIEGYDEMNVGEVSERLDGLSVEELKRVRKYEKRNKDRGSLRKEMKQKIKTTS